MKQVGIIGASGYTGAELARLLLNHDRVELCVATSRKYAGQKMSDIYPSLRGRTDLVCENPSGQELLDRAELFFTAVPHKTAMDIVPPLLEAGKLVIDLSADYRLRDLDVYEKWYQPHSSPQYLQEAVYGLPELYREKIKKTRLVANTGCFPVTAILGLAPLAEQGLIDLQSLIIDSKTGTSGAGRSANVATLFCEVHDGFRPYKVGGTHRHTPEIEQELSALGGTKATVSFTPHLLPVNRGILSTIYTTPTRPEMTIEDYYTLYEERYRDEPFIRLCPPGSLPSLQHIGGSNFCDIALVKDERTGRLIVISAIDNIGKGASGQAVQNMNLMLGFDETEGLMNIPCFP